MIIVCPRCQRDVEAIDLRVHRCSGGPGALDERRSLTEEEVQSTLRDWAKEVSRMPLTARSMAAAHLSYLGYQSPTMHAPAKPQASHTAVLDTELVDEAAATRSLAPSSLLQLAPGVKPLPEWDRARALLAEGQRCAIKLTDEIERLRRSHLGEGHGGARRGVQVSQIVTLETAKGFQAQLREQLNLHPQQAARLMQEASYQRQILQLAEGKRVVLEDGTVIEPTSEKIEAAGEALRTLSAPFAPKASRVWAGISGAAATKGAARAPIDHLAVWYRGCTSISAHNFEALLGKQRINAIERLAQTVSRLPVEVRQELLMELQNSLAKP